MEANLAEEGLIGPFEFTPIDEETHRIAPQHWMVLLKKNRTELNIDTHDLNRIIPLG
jgi:hypothetical protein